MKRREFITLLGGAASLPLTAHAQQPVPVVGYLGGSDSSGGNHFVEAFRSGLREMGFIEGQNVAIEYRWAEDRGERVPELVADLVRRRVNVICTGNNVTTLAVKKATSEIPHVFVIGLDPVNMGLVSTINRPGRQCHRRVFPYYLAGAEAVGAHAGAAASSPGSCRSSQS